MKKFNKYDTKTYIFMLITAVLIFICVILILMMTVLNGERTPVHNPYSITKQNDGFAGDRQQNEIAITNTQAAQALENGLSNVLPLKNVTLSFNEDYTAGLSGILNKKDLTRLLEEGEVKLPPLIKVAIEFLSEEVTVTAILSIELIQDTGRLNVPLQSLKLSGVDIDPDFLPDDAADAINDAANSLIGEGGKVESLSISDGMMIVKTE